MPVKRSKSHKERASDRGDSKLSAKSSRKKKETTQPANEGDSKVLAKSSRKSLEKAQPADESDSKVPTREAVGVRRQHSRRMRIIAKCLQREAVGVRRQHSQRTRVITKCLQRAKNDALLVDEEDSELPVKRNSKRQKKKPERNLTGKRTLVVNQNDVESGEDKDTDKLKDDNKLKDDKHCCIEKFNVEIEEDGQHGSDAIESDDDDLAIVEEDGKNKMFIQGEQERSSVKEGQVFSQTYSHKQQEQEENPTTPIVRNHLGLCPISVDKNNCIVKLNAVLSTTLQLSCILYHAIQQTLSLPSTEKFRVNYRARAINCAILRGFYSIRIVSQRIPTAALR